MNTKKLNLLELFFIRCSGASISIINVCPEFEKIKYVSIGATIFFTSLLAFISSFYGLSQIFDSYLLIFPLAVFWGLIIFNLDRYIVQSLRPGDSKYNNLIISIPRIVLAVMVAVIISKPLEVKLFEDEINAYLSQQKIDNTFSIEQRYNDDIAVLNSQKLKYEEGFENKLELRNRYYEDYLCECNGSCGTKRKGRGIECEERKLKYELYSKELEIERAKKEILIDAISTKENNIYGKMSTDRAVVMSSFNIGFFDRITALNEVGNVSSIFIMLIFILIETAPLLTKLLSKKGPYDNLVMQAEFEFETNFLKIRDFNINQREKNVHLNKISSDLEIKSKETQIKKEMRDKTLQRYEQISKGSNPIIDN